MRAEDVVVGDDLRAAVHAARRRGGASTSRSRCAALHQVENALAAAAAALVVRRRPRRRWQAGLAAAVLSPWRMELATAPSGATVLNDAYNANPTSVAAALESLAALPAAAPHGGPRDHGRARRAGGGRARRHRRPGQGARHPADRGRRPGLRRRGRRVDRGGARRSSRDLGDGDAVLVKGSRVAGLERLAAALLAADRRSQVDGRIVRELGEGDGRPIVRHVGGRPQVAAVRVSRRGRRRGVGGAAGSRSA